MSKKKEGLFVRELLKNTYDRLAERNPHQEIVLAEPALAEIANDSDWHRTRIGYMKYEKANFLQLDNKNWAIGRGESYGSYPAEPYDSDILALELVYDEKKSEKIKEKIRKGRTLDLSTISIDTEMPVIQERLKRGIENSRYFENTLVCGMADGHLATGGRSSWYPNPFKERMLELLKPKIDDFIEQKAEYDTRYILASTLRHPTTKLMLYKPNFVDFLTETIEFVLKEVE